MEQRKVVLSCGPLQLAPTSARIGVLVTHCAVEVTTILQFDNIPTGPVTTGFIMPAWYLYFPVSVANGRLTETAILHNLSQFTPTVSFFKQQSTVIVGPCVPNQQTLVFSFVTVYVPSYRQSFILHLHMGARYQPCSTMIRIRSMLTEDVSAQIRGFNGVIQAVLQPEVQDDCSVNSYISTHVMLDDMNNSKLHVYTTGCFGVQQPFCVFDGDKYWQFSNQVKGQAHLWILKPPARDFGLLCFYVSETTKPHNLQEPQDVLAVAASIINHRDEPYFFVDKTPCITLHSHRDQLQAFCSKVYDLLMHGAVFQPWLNAMDWTWRTEITETPSVHRILAVLGL